MSLRTGSDTSDDAHPFRLTTHIPVMFLHLDLASPQTLHTVLSFLIFLTNLANSASPLYNPSTLVIITTENSLKMDSEYYLTTTAIQTIFDAHSPLTTPPTILSLSCDECQPRARPFCDVMLQHRIIAANNSTCAGLYTDEPDKSSQSDYDTARDYPQTLSDSEIQYLSTFSTLLHEQILKTIFALSVTPFDAKGKPIPHPTPSPTDPPILSSSTSPFLLPIPKRFEIAKLARFAAEDATLSRHDRFATHADAIAFYSQSLQAHHIAPPSLSKHISILPIITSTLLENYGSRAAMRQWQNLQAMGIDLLQMSTITFDLVEEQYTYGRKPRRAKKTPTGFDALVNAIKSQRTHHTHSIDHLVTIMPQSSEPAPSKDAAANPFTNVLLHPPMTIANPIHTSVSTPSPPAIPFNTSPSHMTVYTPSAADSQNRGPALVPTTTHIGPKDLLAHFPQTVQLWDSLDFTAITDTTASNAASEVSSTPSPSQSDSSTELSSESAESDPDPTPNQETTKIDPPTTNSATFPETTSSPQISIKSHQGRPLSYHIPSRLIDAAWMEENSTAKLCDPATGYTACVTHFRPSTTSTTNITSPSPPYEISITSPALSAPFRTTTQRTVLSSHVSLPIDIITAIDIAHHSTTTPTTTTSSTSQQPSPKRYAVQVDNLIVPGPGAKFLSADKLPRIPANNPHLFLAVYSISYASGLLALSPQKNQLGKLSLQWFGEKDFSTSLHTIDISIPLFNIIIAQPSRCISTIDPNAPHDDFADGNPDSSSPGSSGNDAQSNVDEYGASYDDSCGPSGQDSPKLIRCYHNDIPVADMEAVLPFFTPKPFTDIPGAISINQCSSQLQRTIYHIVVRGFEGYLAALPYLNQIALAHYFQHRLKDTFAPR